MTWDMWNLILVRLETVLVSVQDSCTVCVKRTTCPEMFRTQPVVLLGDKAQVEARLNPFGDSANLDAR